MRVGAIPESVAERLAVAAGVAPIPLYDTFISVFLARTVMVATKVGAFEALAKGPLTAEDVARRCDSDPRAVARLLDALTGTGYVTRRKGRYGLGRLARTWLLQDSPRSLRDKVLFQFVEWRFVEQYEDYVRTGHTVHMHDQMSQADWKLYQQAMYSLARNTAPEIVRKAPVRRNPRRMLDVGGSHGFVSVAFCRRYPGLRSTVLDLPEAIEHAAPLLAREDMGDRVVHRAGDATRDELEAETYDIVFVGQLIHHFNGEQNRDLVARAAAALRPEGTLVVYDAAPRHEHGDQHGALANLYGAVASASKAWSEAEIAGWMTGAGLMPGRPIPLRAGTQWLVPGLKSRR